MTQVTFPGPARASFRPANLSGHGHRDGDCPGGGSESGHGRWCPARLSGPGRTGQCSVVGASLRTGRARAGPSSHIKLLNSNRSRGLQVPGTSNSSLARSRAAPGGRRPPRHSAAAPITRGKIIFRDIKSLPLYQAVRVGHVDHWPGPAAAPQAAPGSSRQLEPGLLHNHYGLVTRRAYGHVQLEVTPVQCRRRARVRTVTGAAAGQPRPRRSRHVVTVTVSCGTGPANPRAGGQLRRRVTVTTYIQADRQTDR